MNTQRAKELTIEVPNILDYNYITLRGDLNHFSSKIFVEDVSFVLEKVNGILVIECNELTLIDGGGIAALVLLAIHLEKTNRTLLLKNLNGQPKQMLDVLEIYDFFNGSKWDIGNA